MKICLKCILWICLFFISFSTCGQTDTVVLNEVTVSAYLGNRPVLRLPASVGIADSLAISRQPGQSLVPVLNTVAGVRMEERSPGSYRLSVRGSLIRSPFGIRNIKVYLDELPLTNAGGETYLNLIDIGSVNSIEVLKGPDGSLFGANSGGVVNIKPVDLKNNNSFVLIGTGAGSFNLFQQQVNVQQMIGKNILNINGSWQHSDGYRKNSMLDRKFFRVSNRYQYGNNGTLKLLFFYSDLNYQTPGGLTRSQFQNDPVSARPATFAFPGAEEQKAGIQNRTLFGGITNEINIKEGIKNVFSVFGSKTWFRNPFITNYETRDENNFGIRTWFELKNSVNNPVKLTFNVGTEGQEMLSQITNYGNYKGNRDTVQASDELTVVQGFAFTRICLDFYNALMLEASLSCNANRFVFSRQQPVLSTQYIKTFDPQFMPRVSVSYIISGVFSLRGIVSKGYSPPTLQEIRASDNTLNKFIQPENGWNYEAGFRYKTKKELLWWDASVFYYKLDQAIVKRTNAAGQDYFINAGGTIQPGIESQLTLKAIKEGSSGFLKGLDISQASTFNFFEFSNYSGDAINYSGNALTGVPRQVFVTGVTLRFPLNFYFFVQHNYTERIPLDDANSEYADAYNLLQAKAGYKFKVNKKISLELSAGIDNVLHQRYSLGSDLNAAGRRYYNAAPGRNYFGKINILFK